MPTGRPERRPAMPRTTCHHHDQLVPHRGDGCARGRGVLSLFNGMMRELRSDSVPIDFLRQSLAIDNAMMIGSPATIIEKLKYQYRLYANNNSSRTWTPAPCRILGPQQYRGAGQGDRPRNPVVRGRPIRMNDKLRVDRGGISADFYRRIRLQGDASWTRAASTTSLPTASWRCRSTTSASTMRRTRR